MILKEQKKSISVRFCLNVFETVSFKPCVIADDAEVKWLVPVIKLPSLSFKVTVVWESVDFCNHFLSKISFGLDEMYYDLQSAGVLKCIAVLLISVSVFGREPCSSDFLTCLTLVCVNTHMERFLLNVVWQYLVLASTAWYQFHDLGLHSRSKVYKKARSSVHSLFF